MDCGDEPWGQSVTDFLINDALQQQDLFFSKTTLFYYDDVLVGFVTLVSSVLEVSHAPAVTHRPGISDFVSRPGRSLIPSVLIARFGVHRDYQRQGIGRTMFDWTLAEVMESGIGTRLLILHVSREHLGGREFWRACGFRPGSGGVNILMWLDLCTLS